MDIELRYLDGLIVVGAIVAYGIIMVVAEQVRNAWKSMQYDRKFRRQYRRGK